MGITVCPLGLCRTEEDCPNAPCLECMRRLGEHMIEEIKIVERQALVARSKGDMTAFRQFSGMLASLGFAMSDREPALPWNGGVLYPLVLDP